MAGAGSERLPLRPQTLGELLDAATNLLRRNAPSLLRAGFLLALVEQLALYPLRRAAAVTPPWYLPPHFDRLAQYWLLLAVGLGTESLIVALLGGLAARAAVADLIGTAPPRRLVGAGGRLGALAGLALLVGAGAALGSAAGLVPWLLWYLLAGLAAPAMLVDQRFIGNPPARMPDPRAPHGAGPAVLGPSGAGWLPGAAGAAGRFVPIGPFTAIGRSVTLVGRGGWRAGGIRLLGYLAWWTIRLGLAAGSLSLLFLVLDSESTVWGWVAGMTAWTIVNAIAYPALGCLDAVLHLETRMRVEGLDIALSRALRRHRPTEPALAVPR